MGNKDLTATSGGGVGICTVLFLIFLVLKLCGAITWSWWWVTAPLWIPFVICLAVCLICFTVGLAIGLCRCLIKYIRGR